MVFEHQNFWPLNSNKNQRKNIEKAAIKNLLYKNLIKIDNKKPHLSWQSFHRSSVIFIETNSEKPNEHFTQIERMLGKRTEIENQMKQNNRFFRNNYLRPTCFCLSIA